MGGHGEEHPPLQLWVRVPHGPTQSATGRVHLAEPPHLLAVTGQDHAGSHYGSSNSAAGSLILVTLVRSWNPLGNLQVGACCLLGLSGRRILVSSPLIFVDLNHCTPTEQAPPWWGSSLAIPINSFVLNGLSL